MGEQEKTYLINEIFYSIQGEGRWVGAPSVFVRFSKCNLTCSFCDTEFDSGERMTAVEILAKASSLHGQTTAEGIQMVFTGGEPSLQLDADLVNAANACGYYTTIETNGTRNLDHLQTLDWITVSPKAPFNLMLSWADELKLVSCYLENIPAIREKVSAGYWYLQPMADGDIWNNAEVKKCVEFVLANPTWKLSTQNHKTLGLK